LSTAPSAVMSLTVSVLPSVAIFISPLFVYQGILEGNFDFLLLAGAKLSQASKPTCARERFLMPQGTQEKGIGDMGHRTALPINQPVAGDQRPGNFGPTAHECKRGNLAFAYFSAWLYECAILNHSVRAHDGSSSYKHFLAEPAGRPELSLRRDPSIGTDP